MEFKGVKWSLGGISGRMIKTNQYPGYIADVDTKANALLMSKAPEMLEGLKEALKFAKMKNDDTMVEYFTKLIKEATEL